MTAKTGPTPLDVVATVTTTIGARSEAIPLYATDGALAQGDFTSGPDGVAFALREGVSTRLTQFANKPSSKQPQANYSLVLPGGAPLRIEIDGGAGGYAADCFLCLQVYDRDERFITQFWNALSGSGAAAEIELPKKAARGCFSIQLSGSGLVRDLAVRLTAHGKGDLDFEDDVHDAEGLRDLMYDGRTSAAASESLGRTATGRPAFVIASIAKWYSDRAYSDIVELLGAVAPLAGAGDVDRVLAHLRYYVARALGNLNATESALETIADLKAMADWRKLLGTKEVQNVLILQGQALVRNGRVEEGLAALDVARLNEPKHWEAYFLLANNLEEDDVQLRDAYYRKARVLLGKPHPKLSVAAVEHDLRHGRWSAAQQEAIAGIESLDPPNDLWLALANVHLSAGDAPSWRDCVQSYFAQYGLTPPLFSDEPAGAPDRYTSVSTLPAEPDERDRGVVAVIMTTFNSADTLPLAVESVLAQSYRRIKLVIVDDASSDGTVAAAQAYAARDPRVEVMVQEANGGTYAGKNAALARVGADYYTFHDSDDWMHPERIARHLDEMESAGAACTTSLWFRMEASGKAAARHAGGYQHTNPASIFIRRDVLATVGYFDCVRTGADTEFVWRIRHRFSREEVREIALPLAIGLFHDASLTQSGVTAFNRHRFSEVRLAYWESWVRWHLRTLAGRRGELHLPYPLDERRFWAPPAITPEGAEAAAESGPGPIEAAGGAR